MLYEVITRRGDEISRLAWNVNNLIARMRGTLRAERDLRAQHQAAGQKWRLIFENAETGIFTLSREGVLHDWNPWLALTLGLPVNVITSYSIHYTKLYDRHLGHPVSWPDHQFRADSGLFRQPDECLPDHR